MIDLDDVLKGVDTLSADDIQKLYSYLQERLTSAVPTEKAANGQPRVPGLHPHLGRAWLSDDFWHAAEH